MATQMAKPGYENVFVGTVEGEPEETFLRGRDRSCHEAGYTFTVVLQVP